MRPRTTPQRRTPAAAALIAAIGVCAFGIAETLLVACGPRICRRGFNTHETSGRVDVEFVRDMRHDWSRECSAQIDHFFAGRFACLDFGDPDQQTLVVDETFVVATLGWPCAVWQGYAEVGDGRQYLVSDYRRLFMAHLGTLANREPGSLQWSLRWWGLAADTTIAAIASVAVHTAISSCVHRRRSRAGLCRQCGYPRVASAPCPECGRKPEA